MNVDPNLAAMMSHLAELAIPSVTNAIYSKVDAITRGKANEQTVNELRQIINDLIKERNDLVGIAQAFEQELVAQRMSDKDIEYIIDTVVPVLKQLVENMDQSGNSEVAQRTEEGIDLLAPLLSVKTLTVLQLLGFNYKRAVGEPLTLLVQRLIMSQMRPDPQTKAETERIGVEANHTLLQIAQDEEAAERLRRVLIDWRGPQKENKDQEG